MAYTERMLDKMRKYNLLKNSMVAGQKITLVAQGNFGGMYVFQTIFDHAEPAPHYQDCPEDKYGVKIYHTPKRKRSLYASVLDYNTPFIIYAGWKDIDLDALIYEILPLTDEQKAAGSFELRKSKYLSFDHQYFRDCVATYPNPLVSDF